MSAKLPWRFVLAMAWRDSRASRRRLLLFASCIVIGIAALVAVGSLGRALEQGIEHQARTLLGADLSIGSRVRFGPEHERFLASLGGEQSREITFSSMLVFPAAGGTRLVQVRALAGGFPYYGRIETEPAEAESRFRREGGVLVEESLLLQFGVRVGDEVRIGGLTTRVAGSLQKVPGESVAFATIAPRVFLRMSDLEATGLMREGSLARYRVLFRLPEGTDVAGLVATNRARLDALRLAVATVAERKEDLGESMKNLQRFLNLVGFVALLLGGLGIASAIQVHVKQKVPTVAVLRCLGCPVRVAFAIYLVQGMALGAVGAVFGALGGVGIQRLLPAVVADFVPFAVEIGTSWAAIGEAAAVGFVVCVLFALLPLTAVRRVSPLEVLRVAYESGRRRRDPWQVGVVALLGLAIVGFALGHSRRWEEGLGAAAGLFVAFGALAGVAKAAIAGARRLRIPGWPFVVRQGLASLHRPNNRTLLLVVSLGFGTFLLLTLQLTQGTLLKELFAGRDPQRANAILFDIQADQREPVAGLVRGQGLPVLDEAPIVTMRLKTLRGRAVEEWLADPEAKARGWILRREFRSTFTDRLRESEKITAGEWVGSVEPGVEPVPVSVEDGIAKELGLGLGDEVVWDIQGVPLRTTVASLREVDWRRVQPNFFVLFPRGPLDDAPAFHVLVTRVGTAEESARLQRAVVERFPNVSAIDITLVLRTLDQILGKVAFVIRFMALFTVATGLVVLVAAILSGRWQRVRESILLRVLGASRRQVLRILLVEYAALGLLAAVTGVVLAFAGSAALALFVFRVPFVPALGPAAAAVGLVTGLTVATGWLSSRGVTTHPPLEILRNEP
jgi:putative ABC transport system permease protein